MQQCSRPLEIVPPTLQMMVSKRRREHVCVCVCVLRKSKKLIESESKDRVQSECRRDKSLQEKERGGGGYTQT